MTVPSWQFLLFVLAGAAVFNAVPVRWREAIWLVLNLVFVWTLGRGVLPLMPLAGFLALGYLCAAAARSGAPKIAIGLVFAAFVWLKRYSFVPEQWLLPPGAMTIGLSYIFFRVMHLVIDAGQDAERTGVLRYLNFTLNFPAFISGPIQRLGDYETHGSLPLRLSDIGFAAWRIILGAFKVLILSAILQRWQHDALDALTPGLPLVERAWTVGLAVVLYPLFLYANFSGYTDFVIGAARLFRLQLPENFDRPFSSVNFIEFWNRWHISLSQWLRSYVFNPFLVNWMRRVRSARGKQYPAVLAFFVTFFLVGAWHGQTSAFLFFGLLQGSGVAGNRLYQVAMASWLSPAGYDRLSENRLYRSMTRGLTFTWFAFTLLWFWAGWAEIAALGWALGWTGGLLAAFGTFAIASFILALPDMAGVAASRTESMMRSRYTRTAFAAAMMLAIAVSVMVLNLSSPEIVYKQF